MHIIWGVMIKYHSKSDNQIWLKIIYGVLANRSGVLARKACKDGSEEEVEDESKRSEC